MHHNNFGNFYTREIYAIPIPIGFIPISISIPIMSRMAIPILMGMGFQWCFPLPCTPLVLTVRADSNVFGRAFFSVPTITH